MRGRDVTETQESTLQAARCRFYIRHAHSDVIVRPATDLATCSGTPWDSIQPMKSGPSPKALINWSESRSQISATTNLEIVFPRISRMGLPSASVRKPASSHEFPTNRISLPQTLVCAVNDFKGVFSLPQPRRLRPHCVGQARLTRPHILQHSVSTFCRSPDS